MFINEIIRIFRIIGARQVFIMETDVYIRNTPELTIYHSHLTKIFIILQTVFGHGKQVYF